MKKITIGGKAEAATLIELNGATRETVRQKQNKSTTVLRVAMPRFGLRTIRLKNFKSY